MVAAKQPRDGRSADDLPRMDFYPRDWLSDRRVRTMTTEQRGCYIDLLCFAWLDGPLPNDHAALARLLGISTRAFNSRIWPALEACYREDGDHLVQPRQERERARAVESRRKAREKGRKGGLAKKSRRSTGRTTARPEGVPRGSPSPPTDGDGDGSVFHSLGELDAESALDQVPLIYERCTALPPGNWCPAVALDWAPAKFLDVFDRRGVSLVLGEYEEWLRAGNRTTHVNEFLKLQAAEAAAAPSPVDAEDGPDLSAVPGIL